MSRNVARKLGFFLLSLTSSCGLLGDDTPSISLAASASTAGLERGGRRAVTLVLGRTNLENPIQLAVEGTLPAGLTANFAQNPLAAGSNTTTLTITATGSAT